MKFHLQYPNHHLLILANFFPPQSIVKQHENLPPQAPLPVTPSLLQSERSSALQNHLLETQYNQSSREHVLLLLPQLLIGSFSCVFSCVPPPPHRHHAYWLEDPHLYPNPDLEA